MKHVRMGKAMLVAGVCLAWLLGPQLAMAHGKEGDRVAIIQGTVTGIGAAVQVQTQTGGVALTLNGTTRIERVAMGSLADVHAGQNVDARLIAGTSTINGITIDQTKPQRPQSRLGGHSRDLPRHSPATRSEPPLLKGPANEVHGQVIAVNSTSLTFRGRQGRAIAYALQGSVSVTKIMDGTPSDLAIGETVRASRSAAGVAIEIMILKA